MQQKEPCSGNQQSSFYLDPVLTRRGTAGQSLAFLDLE